MFHPTRPFVRWSSVDIRRAKVKGCSYDVEAVTPKPRCSVTYAIAETSSIGSLTGICAPGAQGRLRSARVDVVDPDHVRDEQSVK